MKNSKHREVMRLAQGHTGSKWLTWNDTQASLVPKPMLTDTECMVRAEVW